MDGKALILETFLSGDAEPWQGLCIPEEGQGELLTAQDPQLPCLHSPVNPSSCP